MSELELVIDARATLGEGPSWDAKNQLLYWVDIRGKKVHIYDPKSNNSRSIDTGQQVGALVPRDSGGLILAMQQGFYALDVETGELTGIADPEEHLPNNRFNDGKCDAAGRFWAGTMDNDEVATTGALYCLEKDLTVRKIFDQVGISNGIAWESDNKTMYYIDTPTRQVVAFDFDLDSGTLSNKRVVVHFPEGEGFPDGMTIDAEEMIWVAHWGGYQLSRWNPRTGEKLESIPVPAANVSSCVFGGENLDELYITTARKGLDEDTLSKYPHTGGVFRLKTKVKGSPTYRFGG